MREGGRVHEGVLSLIHSVCLHEAHIRPNYGGDYFAAPLPWLSFTCDSLYLPPVRTHTVILCHSHPAATFIYDLRRTITKTFINVSLKAWKTHTYDGCVSLWVHTQCLAYSTIDHFSYMNVFLLKYDKEKGKEEKKEFTGLNARPQEQTGHFQESSLIINWLLTTLTVRRYWGVLADLLFREFRRFSLFSFVWSAKLSLRFFLDFGQTAAHGGIFLQLNQRLCSSGWGDDRAYHVFRYGGRRETALLIRILGEWD